MKFPSLHKLTQVDVETGTIVERLNQWAVYIEQLADNITFADNFSQITSTQTTRLNTAISVSLSGLNSNKYKVELVDITTTSPEIILIGPSLDWQMSNNKRFVNITPRVNRFKYVGSGTVPIVDNIQVTLTVQVLGVE